MRIYIGILIFLFTLSGCTENHKYTKGKHNMIFIYNEWLSVDFNSKVVKIDFSDFKYVDTLNFSDAEEDSIIKSFNGNKIEELDGEQYYSSRHPDMPPQTLTVETFESGKFKARLVIYDDYTWKDNPEFGKSYNVIRFRDDILAILKNNGKFKKALDICSKHQRKSGRASM